ncbi:phosphoglucosamine mutase [uncultured Maritalea sp.]|uniref:phosphoglucosamine mutase n=1 Tax=uncultured Maritalea sp. TaxID=757249 RepID=UPI00262B7BE4|nr:phosphoglucosamine mutase [uncultured Maritalea sp.]
MGSFEPVAKPWGHNGIPEDFSFDELPPDLDHFEPFLFNAMKRIPALENTGIHTWFNGPESFTPDDRYMLGETDSVQNLFVATGFNSVGMDVFLLGPMPTPAVAMLTRSLRADLGVMISASHNPYDDNGIKLFQPDGFKLTDEMESEIEALLNSDLADELVRGREIGRAHRIEEARGRYSEYAKRTLPRLTEFSGLRVVVDCANGAAYKSAPEVLWELGAEVITIGVSPDGYNINEGCGSTAPHLLQQKVRETRADIGIALDGDADRVVIVDEKGDIIDGDQLMAALAMFWQEQGKLKGEGVVATVMSNLGLERYLNSRDLSLERTQVGDRYVLERMREGGFNLGGEQSGHIILSDHTTTGDGLVSALQIMALIQTKDKPVSEVCRLFDTVPQLLTNVRYESGAPLENILVKQAIAAGEEKMGDSGRLVIRASGTEPLIRVMGECDDEKLVNDVVGDIADVIQQVA